MPFVKGECGNPSGRPPGSRNKAAVVVEAMLAAEGEGLARGLISKAREGDSGALRLCLDQVLLEARGADIDLPAPATAEGAQAGEGAAAGAKPRTDSGRQAVAPAAETGGGQPGNGAVKNNGNNEHTMPPAQANGRPGGGAVRAPEPDASAGPRLQPAGAAVLAAGGLLARWRGEGPRTDTAVGLLLRTPQG